MSSSRISCDDSRISSSEGVSALDSEGSVFDAENKVRMPGTRASGARTGQCCPLRQGARLPHALIISGHFL